MFTVEVKYFMQRGCFSFQYYFFTITFCNLTFIIYSGTANIIISYYLLFLMPSQSCMEYKEY